MDDDQLRLREAAVTMRRAGRTRREIRSALGVSDPVLTVLLDGEPPARSVLRPRAKDDLRARARELRRERWSVPRIAVELGVARSTAWLWTKDIPLPAKAAEANRRHGLERQQKRDRLSRRVDRWRTKIQASREVGRIRDRELLLMGVVLYWAEGAKDKPWARRESLDFVNSDPDVIRFYLSWLALLGVSKDRLRFAVQIHESADVEAAVVFWADLVGLPRSSFQSTVLKRHNPRTTRKNINERYRGTLRIKVRRSAQLYQRVEGLWRGIAGAATESRWAEFAPDGPFDPAGTLRRHRRQLNEGREQPTGQVAEHLPGPSMAQDHPGVFRFDVS